MRILMLMMTNLFAAMAISWIFNANFTTICPVVHMLTFSPNFFLVCVNRFPKTLAGISKQRTCSVKGGREDRQQNKRQTTRVYVITIIIIDFISSILRMICCNRPTCIPSATTLWTAQVFAHPGYCSRYNWVISFVYRVGVIREFL